MGDQEFTSPVARKTLSDGGTENVWLYISAWMKRLCVRTLLFGSRKSIDAAPLNDNLAHFLKENKQRKKPMTWQFAFHAAPQRNGMPKKLRQKCFWTTISKVLGVPWWSFVEMCGCFLWAGSMWNSSRVHSWLEDTSSVDCMVKTHTHTGWFLCLVCLVRHKFWKPGRIPTSSGFLWGSQSLWGRRCWWRLLSLREKL